MKKIRSSLKFIGFVFIFLLLISSITQGAPPSGGGFKKKPQPGMSITVPATAKPGEQILIRVEPVNGAQLSWASAGTDRGNILGVLENSPFEFQYTIPEGVVGILKIVAMGVDAPNDTGYLVEAMIQVSTTATLESFSQVPELSSPLPELIPASYTVQFDWFGMQRRVWMEGRYSDGVKRNLTLPASGTTYQSQDPSIIETLPDGSLRAVGEGKATVLVSNSGLSVSLEVEVDFPDPKLGDRTGGRGDNNDLALTYSGPLDIGSQQVELPASGTIDLSANSSQARFTFHNNSALGQLGVSPGAVVGEIGKGSDANCSVSFENNGLPLAVYPFEVIDGTVVFLLPSGGGRCVFVLNIEGASDKVADKIVVNNPSP